MEPHLNNKDKVLISSIPYLFKSPKINDIVAFKDRKRKIMIKRIAKIKKSKYFVQGDNNKDSFDSRSFGAIFKNQILGKVIYKF